MTDPFLKPGGILPRPDRPEIGPLENWFSTLTEIILQAMDILRRWYDVKPQLDRHAHTQLVKALEVVCLNSLCFKKNPDLIFIGNRKQEVTLVNMTKILFNEGCTVTASLYDSYGNHAWPAVSQTMTIENGQYLVKFVLDQPLGFVI